VASPKAQNRLQRLPSAYLEKTKGWPEFYVESNQLILL